MHMWIGPSLCEEKSSEYLWFTLRKTGVPRGRWGAPFGNYSGVPSISFRYGQAMVCSGFIIVLFVFFNNLEEITMNEILEN